MTCPQRLTDELKRAARELGFDLVGAAPATPPASLDRLRAWLAAGHAGEMDYLRGSARDTPQSVLPQARSVLMLAMNYRTIELPPTPQGTGQVARYAWGDDYHAVIRQRLRELVQRHNQLAPVGHARGVVDTAPLLERDFAQAAGLGWIGRNTALIHPEFGSWLFLAALLSTEELVYDNTPVADGCGACTACLKACPTGALVAPRVLDARRCISYLTIEYRGPIAVELRAAIGARVFGCDACQDACPWNRDTPRAAQAGFEPQPGHATPALMELLALDEAAFAARFRGTPLWRATRAGLARNAAIALGNQRAAAALPALRRAMSDPAAVVRGAAAWALGQLTTEGEEARRALYDGLACEADPQVREEIAAALRALSA